MDMCRGCSRRIVTSNSSRYLDRNVVTARSGAVVGVWKLLYNKHHCRHLIDHYRRLDVSFRLQIEIADRLISNVCFALHVLLATNVEANQQKWVSQSSVVSRSCRQDAGCRISSAVAVASRIITQPSYCFCALLLLSLFSAWCGPCNLQSKVSGQDYYALHGRDRQNVCQSEFGSNNDFDLCLPYEFSHQNDRFGIVSSPFRRISSVRHLNPSVCFQVRRVIAGPVIPFCPWSEHRHFYLLKWLLVLLYYVV